MKRRVMVIADVLTAIDEPGVCSWGCRYLADDPRTGPESVRCSLFDDGLDARPTRLPECLAAEVKEDSHG